MKVLFYSLAFIGVFLALTAQEEARIKKLEGEVKSLQVQVGLLAKRVAALEKQVGELTAGVPGVTYEPKTRDERRIELQYRRYRNRIALVEGRYIKYDEVPRIVRWVGELKVDDFGRIKGEILEILGPEEMLVSIMGYGAASAIERPRERRLTRERIVPRGEPSIPGSQTIFLKGLPTENLTKGQEIRAEVWAAGTFEYEGPTGAKETVIKCIPISLVRSEFRKGITKEQFIEALNQGLVLD